MFKKLCFKPGAMPLLFSTFKAVDAAFPCMLPVDPQRNIKPLLACYRSKGDQLRNKWEGVFNVIGF